jgi:RNA polymerase sigma factor (sigma-70 family)
MRNGQLRETPDKRVEGMLKSYYCELYRFVRASGIGEAADDVLQDVFASLLRYLRDGRRLGDSIHDQRAFLWRCATNGVNEEFRARARRCRAENVAARRKGIADDRGAEHAALARAVEAGLNSLSVDERELVSACVLGTQSLSAYARQSGITRRAAECLRERAFAKLRGELKEWEMIPAGADRSGSHNQIIEN